MTCFFMTDIDSRGGVKLSCQFADALAACGVHCVMVTPEGKAPRWCRSSVAFAAERLAFSRVSAADTVVCSSVRDVERIARLPARLVFHVQGTAAALDPTIANPSITVLTCWPAIAASIRQRTGRDPIEVGIAVDDVFFQPGVRRVAGTVAFVSQSSSEYARRCAAVPHVSMVPIDDAADGRVAAILQASEFYLVPEGEVGCELEILEALASGCIVIGTVRADGAAGLLDALTGIVADGRDVYAVLREWAGPAARIRRAAARDRGRALVAPHRIASLRRRVAALLAGPLAFVGS